MAKVRKLFQSQIMDNYVKHTVHLKSTQEWLKSKLSTVLTQPAINPDLNQIEHGKAEI